MGEDIARPHRDPLARLSIGEVAQQAGRRASSIRYYESIGLLPAPERIAGQRSYAPDVLRLLAVIDAGQRVGLTLEEIRSLLFAGRTGSPIGDTLRELAERKLPEVEALIEHTDREALASGRRQLPVPHRGRVRPPEHGRPVGLSMSRGGRLSANDSRAFPPPPTGRPCAQRRDYMTGTRT